MPLNKSTLAAAIKKVFKDVKDADADEEQSLDMFCNKLADAVDTYVKTAQINYTNGLTAPPNGGPVTGVFNGTLS
jgi:hypothetical protein